MVTVVYIYLIVDFFNSADTAAGFKAAMEVFGRHLGATGAGIIGNFYIGICVHYTGTLSFWGDCLSRPVNSKTEMSLDIEDTLLGTQ